MDGSMSSGAEWRGAARVSLPDRANVSRRRRPLGAHTAAVSDTLGSILLVAITVLMVGGLSAMLLAFDGPQDVQHTKLSIALGPGDDGVWGANEAELVIRHVGGEALPAAGTRVHLTPPGQARYSVEPQFPGGMLRIGDAWSLTVSAEKEDVFRIQVVVATDSGSSLLADAPVAAIGTAGGPPARLTYVTSSTVVLGSMSGFAAAQSGSDAGATASLVEGAASGATVSNLTATTHTNSGATNPGNALVSDDARTTLDVNGEWIEVGGFPTPGGATTVTGLIIGFEGQRTLAPPSVVTHVQTVTGTGAATSSVSALAVTGGSGRVFVAAIANGESNVRTVSAVSGLGVSWAHVGSVTGSDAKGRLEVWLGTGTSSTGLVTATFSGNVEFAAIAVSSYTGVDSASPIQSVQTAKAPGQGSSSWSTASVTGTTNGRLFAAVNAQQRGDVSFSNPATERADFGSGGKVRLATADGAAASGGNVPSGGITGSTDWQSIGLTLRPSVIAPPQVRLSYTVGGIAGASTSLRSLGASDGHFVLDVYPDRTWSVANLSQLRVRVEAVSLAGGTALIDRVYATATTASGPVGYSLDVRTTVAGVPAGTVQMLEVGYRITSGGDSFAVGVWTGSGWRTCPGLLTATSLSQFSCLLALPAEYQSGSPQIRFTDSNPASSVQSTLFLDYVRVATS
jgi:hypothetical protein